MSIGAGDSDLTLQNNPMCCLTHIGLPPQTSLPSRILTREVELPFLKINFIFMHCLLFISDINTSF